MRRLVLLAFLLIATTAQALTLTDYVAQLDAMRLALHEGRVAEAQQQARALVGTEVTSPDGNFKADAALLAAVTTDRLGAEAKLALAIQELRKAAPAATPPGDGKLLERLRREEEADKLKEGGKVPEPPLSNTSLFMEMVDKLGKALEWIGDKLVALWEWLTQFWPRSSENASGGGGATRGMVGGLVALIVIVIGILTWQVLRRSKGGSGADVIASDPIASARDDDPLSRAANEWERYAMQLAAAGRVREAIRAWYHAVLVTCYTAGILHFRKGRTNWEYIASISPELPWRGDFIALTRRFETEWYGRAASMEESLDDCSARARRILETIRRGVAA
jgi:hypothetical protein